MIIKILNNNKLFNNACEFLIKNDNDLDMSYLKSLEFIICDMSDDNKIKGSILYHLLDNNEIYICLLVVEEEFKRMGVATNLIKWLKNEHKYNKIFLHVSKNNTAAINLYKKEYFYVVKDIDKYYTDDGEGLYSGTGVNAYCMVTYS